MATSSALAMHQGTRRKQAARPAQLAGDQLALRQRARVARSQPAWSQHGTLVAGGVRSTFDARAPHIDAGEQEDPHHVDEVPVPGGELEPEVLRRIEMPGEGADQTNNEKQAADDDVESMEPR